MGYLNNNTVPFKRSRIFQTTILLVIIGTITGLIPSYNFWILSLNLFLAFVSAILFYILWRKYSHHSKKYFGLMSYLMLVVMGIHCVIPFFRVLYGTLAFVVGIIIVISSILLPHLYSEAVAYGILNPSKSKLGTIFFIYVGVVFLFGILSYLALRLTGSSDMIAVVTFFLCIGLFFLFLSPIFVIEPKRIDELNK